MLKVTNSFLHRIQVDGSRDHLYDPNVCYCGNKYISIKEPDFNIHCFRHDQGYDQIILLSSHVSLDASKALKKVCDDIFYQQIKKTGKSFKAWLFYRAVRMLPVSYVR